MHSRRYQELQRYVGWTNEDAKRVASARVLVEPHFAALIDDFYAEIERHPDARNVITGGQPQVERLKGTLLGWLRELLSGNYNRAYVERRWKIGRRHVEIGLDQTYANVALSRIRSGLVRALQESWHGDPHELRETVRSLNRLLDLDLTIIQAAYEEEFTRLTASREAALERARSEAAFRTLVEAAGCIIVILRPNHSIAYFSPFAEELTGYSRDEVLGKDYSPIFLPEAYRQPVAEEIKRMLAGGQPTQSFENPVLCKDGSSHSVLWNARALPNYEGGPAILAVGQDITNLKEAQQRLLQSERLAAIGQMMAGLAHESRNALQRTKAFLEQLADELQHIPEILDLVAGAQRAHQNLQRLFEDIRAYAAPVKLDRSHCSLPNIWRQTWTSLEPLRKGREATLREEIGGVNLSCEVDAFRIEQVFRNLMENSLAACRDRVRIEICCSEANIAGSAAVCIAVRDNGPGLTPEQRQNIFEPFFTTKTQGTGLGMAIAHRIVHEHGGQITVGSDSCPGAEILITLPRQ